MFMLNTTLLREKFIIREGNDESKTMIATGNRIALPLMSRTGQREERLIVRAHNMYTTLRMAAMICKAYFRDGPIQSRTPSYPWGPNWDATLPEFETIANPNHWVSVYSGGRPIFRQGDYHPFLDVLEQCDARNRDEYDRAVSIAENAFNLAGRGVSIHHESGIALVIGAMMEKTRVGLILRNPKHMSTFNFGVETKADDVTKQKKAVEPHQCLLHAAAWLELVQLSVNIGFLKVRKGQERSPRQTLDATMARFQRLKAELEQFEESFDVTYRPERPDIERIADQAAAFARYS